MSFLSWLRALFSPPKISASGKPVHLTNSGSKVIADQSFINLKHITSGGLVVALGTAGAMWMSGPDVKVPESWAAARAHVMPQLIASEQSVMMPVIYERKSAGMYQSYVIDHGDTYDFVMYDDFNKWGIDDATLRLQAFQNLDAASQSVNVEQGKVGDKKYVTYEAEDGYAAVRLLLPSFKQKLTETLGEPFYVGVPARNFLVAWQKDFPSHNEFVSEVRKQYDAAGRYQVTPEIFSIQGDVFDVVNKNTGAPAEDSQ